MTLTSGPLTPAMRACSQEIRHADAGKRRIGVVLFVVVEAIVAFRLLENGLTGGAIAGLIAAAILTLLAVVVFWPRGELSLRDDERYCRYAGLLDLCWIEEQDSEGGKYVRYFLRLATAEERRRGERGKEFDVDTALGEQLAGLLSVASPRVVLYQEAERLLFAVWDDRGHCLYHHPGYRAAEDAWIARDAPVQVTGVAAPPSIGDDPATVRTSRVRE